MENKIIKVALYIRVSTDYQAEEGYSIDAQKEQLEAYCISKNIKNYEFYIDGGWSGSNIERPEIQKLIKDIREDKISHVIVYKLDRLSRSQKDTLYLIEDVFNPHGVDFVSLNESMDTSTPMGKLMLGILSAFAQLERENIRLRTRMGMKERVKSGLWMGGGRIPFGYDYDKEHGILVQNNDANKVKQIYKLYIEGKSAQDIATMLGLKYDKLVMQILTRKSNYGIIEYNGEEYQGKHEPIITKEIYDIAMECMYNRRAVRSNDNEHLLTGLVSCGKCGAKMRYQKWSKGDYKFVCYSQQKSKPYLIKDPNCDQMKLWASDVEDMVIKAILQFADNYQSTEDESVVELDTMTILLDQKNELNKKLKRLYSVFSDGDDDDDVLLETISEIKKQITEVDHKIQLEKNTSLANNKKEEKVQIVYKVKNLWNTFTPLQKKTIIRKLISKIELRDECVDIHFSI